MQNWIRGVLYFSAIVGTALTTAANADPLPPSPSTKVATAPVERKDKEVIATLKGHTNWILGVAITEDGRTAVSASFDGTIRVWDTETGRQKVLVKSRGKQIWPVAISPDGEEILTGESGRVAIYDLATGRETWQFQSPKSSKEHVFFMAVNFDRANHFAGASTDGTVYIWDYSRKSAPPQVITARRKAKELSLYTACLSPDGKTLALSTNTRQAASSEIELWDVVKNQLVRRIVPALGNVNHLEFSADGKQLLSCGHSTTRGWLDRGSIASPNNEDSITLRNAAVGGTVRKFGINVPPLPPQPPPQALPNNVAVIQIQENTRIPNDAKFSPDGKHIVTAERDGSILIYTLDSEKPITTLRRHTNEVRSLAFSADGARFVSVSMDNTGIVWDWQEVLRRKE